MSLGRARADLIGGVVGAAVLLIAAFALRLPIILAIVIGVVVYVALRLLIPPPTEVAPGMTRGDVDRVIRDGQSRVAQIQTLARQIRRQDVRAHVEKTASIAGDIYTDFQQRPADISRIPNFATTYLDPLINVLSRYVRLTSVESGGNSDPTITNIEQSLLPKVETSFEGLYRQLIQDDVTDLDAASEGLKALLDLGT